MTSSGAGGDAGGEAGAAALTVPPAAASVRAARRFVEGRLTQAGLVGDLVDTAILLVSELVTNAVLHASTDVEVRVRVGGATRIEVRDGSGTAPVRRQHTEESVTGRGLELVEMLATNYGVEHSAGGKSVWFTVGEDGTGEGAWGWQDGESGPAAMPVELLGLPRILHEVMAEHHEAILRDYALYCLDHAEEPAQLTREISAAGAVHAAISEAVRAQLPAVSEPTQRVDVRVLLPAEQAAALPSLRTVLGDAERLAAVGSLLTRPALPELQALRDWCLDQLRDQIAGGAPRSWLPPEAADDVVPVPGAVDVSWVARETRRVVVGDANNRIIAVSPAAGSLLGWAPEDLAGRRIVTIIPERLREAHVAGFTRQLITGRVHILDRPTPLPARHRDGHEIPAMVTLQRRQDGDVVFFLGWIVTDAD